MTPTGPAGPPGAAGPATRASALDLLYRYAWATDECDEEGLAACFTDDATIRFTVAGEAPRAELTGARQIAATVIAGRRAQADIRRHFITNALVTEVSADSLRVKAFFLLTVVSQGALMAQSSGVYDMVLAISGDHMAIARGVATADCAF